MTLALLAPTCCFAATDPGQAEWAAGPWYPAGSPAICDAKIGYSIVKERWFVLPGQPQPSNQSIKAYCNNSITELSRQKIHPEIPGGYTGRIGTKAQTGSGATVLMRAKRLWLQSITKIFLTASNLPAIGVYS